LEDFRARLDSSIFVCVWFSLRKSLIYVLSIFVLDLDPSNAGFGLRVDFVGTLAFWLSLVESRFPHLDGFEAPNS
jgi:hypothetical protein